MDRSHSSGLEAAAELLRQEQAAQFLNVSVRTLEAWRHRGGGPRYVKLHRCVRYRRADLLDWLDAHARTSTSQISG